MRSSAVAGCGRAALQITPCPGDREASPRRLEALARTFERSFGCAVTDTIQITGMAPGVYTVLGCEAIRDHLLGCRPGGYAAPIRNRAPVPDLGDQASVDMNCAAQCLEQTPGGPMQRAVVECGLHATYVLHCGGSGCGWTLAGPVAPLDPVTSPTSDPRPYTY